MTRVSALILLLTLLLFSGCELTVNETESSSSSSTASTLDQQLASTVAYYGITGDPSTNRSIPDINDASVQLGKRLFFSKSLSGNRDTACASCHHPALGGGDNLTLSVGVEAANPNVLGPGRVHSESGTNYDGGPPVPRNAPTTFNISLWDSVMFHDGRAESLGKTEGKNGDDGLGIRTPDSTYGTADENSGANLVLAQARFPVTSNEEMKGFAYDDKSRQEIRDFLAARLGGYGEGEGILNDTAYWLEQFRKALGDSDGSAETLITEENIFFMIGEYERSQLFIDSPWKSCLNGDTDALSDSAKNGALLFFNAIEDGGANCVRCHSGDFLSDEQFHNVGMPQLGRGKGDGDGSEDYGRYRESGLASDKYAFRTPSLLNVEVTGPWSHAGAFSSLKSLLKYHLDPEEGINTYDPNELEQEGIQNLESFRENTRKAIESSSFDMTPVTLSDTQINELVEFLYALSDPCVKDMECLAEWIADPVDDYDPNGDLLQAIDQSGNQL